VVLGVLAERMSISRQPEQSVPAEQHAAVGKAPTVVTGKDSEKNSPK
jgi:hypothetical protein